MLRRVPGASSSCKGTTHTACFLRKTVCEPRVLFTTKPIPVRMEITSLPENPLSSGINRRLESSYHAALVHWNTNFFEIKLRSFLQVINGFFHSGSLACGPDLRAFSHIPVVFPVDNRRECRRHASHSLIYSCRFGTPWAAPPTIFCLYLYTVHCLICLLPPVSRWLRFQFSYFPSHSLSPFCRSHLSLSGPRQIAEASLSSLPDYCSLTAPPA